MPLVGGKEKYMFYRFTFLDFLKMMWWGVTNPPPKQNRELDKHRCPHCLRPYNTPWP